MFCKLASDIALAFLADYPTPQAAARLGQARLAAFCRRHAYRGGKPPAELLARLRTAPVPPNGLAPAVLAQLVSTQVQVLRSLQATIGELETAIKQRVAQHPRAKLLRGLPGVGTVNLAQLLAEVGPILDRVSTAEQAAAECGAAPVTRASGKTSGVYFRWAANPRARTALTAFAHNARMQSPWAGRLYADARARGKRNPHATRIVARAWLRVIWACWHTNTPYDPCAHLAEQRLAAA
jgi:transposase